MTAQLRKTMTPGPTSPTIFERCHGFFYAPLHLKCTDEGDKASYLSPTANGVIITACMTSARDVLMLVDTQDCTMS